MANAQSRILLVDDDPIILESLSEFLRMENYAVATASNCKNALDQLKVLPVNLVIADVNLPDSNGFELLRNIRERSPQTAVILITGYGTIESAVDAIKLGAYDYLTKPIVDEEIKLSIERALNQQALVAENRSLKQQLNMRYSLQNVVGQDYRMAKIFDVVETVADSKITVLITGESGTGKSLLARAIHRLSSRQDEPFIEVSCGAIPESLLESELFGHVKGAFTGAVADKVGKFQAADGGTLFLDEVATASPSLQVKLLRALQERQFEPVGSNQTVTVNTRVLLATNLDLEEEVRAGRFRQDLYYRINVVNLTMPNLRDRIGDIPLLAKHFLSKYQGELSKDITGFKESALAALSSYHWPGNVRELQNAVERAIVFCKGRYITLEDLPPQLQACAEVPLAQRRVANWTTGQSLQEALAVPEREIIKSALETNNWNRQATADHLQINRTTLYKKMKRYGLSSMLARAS